MKNKDWKLMAMNHCLETLVDLTEEGVHPHPKKIIDLLGKAIRRYEKEGFTVPQKYKDKYRELEDDKE